MTCRIYRTRHDMGERLWGRMQGFRWP